MTNLLQGRQRALRETLRQLRFVGRISKLAEQIGLHPVPRCLLDFNKRHRTTRKRNRQTVFRSSRRVRVVVRIAVGFIRHGRRSPEIQCGVPARLLGEHLSERC